MGVKDRSVHEVFMKEYVFRSYKLLMILKYCYDKIFVLHMETVHIYKDITVYMQFTCILFLSIARNLVLVLLPVPSN